MSLADTARRPNLPGIEPGDWWRAYLTVAAVTGWRINSMLALRWSDVDLKTGQMTVLSGNSKTRKVLVKRLPEEAIPLLAAIKVPGHEVVFGDRVLKPGERNKEMYAKVHLAFQNLQRAAGIKLPCRHQHAHTCKPSCFTYHPHTTRIKFANDNLPILGLEGVSNALDHSDVRVTQNGYLADSGDNSAEVAALIKKPAWLRAGA
jgi:integrase